jgi:putative flippase GtrA
MNDNESVATIAQEMRQTVARVWLLKWRFLAYLIVGASGVLVNLLAFTQAEHLLGTASRLVLVASTSAFAVALFWNFVWNYIWTFRDRRHRPLYFHLGIYAAIQLVALGVNLGILDLWTLRFGVSTALWGQFLGILAGSAWGFGANLRWNFRISAIPVPS